MNISTIDNLTAALNEHAALATDPTTDEYIARYGDSMSGWEVEDQIVLAADRQAWQRIDPERLMPGVKTITRTDARGGEEVYAHVTDEQEEAGTGASRTFLVTLDGATWRVDGLVYDGRFHYTAQPTAA